MKNKESTPEGKIFEEMDDLAKKISTKLLAKGHQSDWMEGTIREQLDEWVTKRVVRFQASERCELYDMKLDHIREKIEERITQNMAYDVAKMCGLPQTDIIGKDHYLTLYVMAFKDNF